MVIIPKNVSHSIHDYGHLTHSHPALRFGETGMMNSFMEMFSGSMPNNQKKKPDTFAPIVLELAGHYINLLIIRKFTLTHSVWLSIFSVSIFTHSVKLCTLFVRLSV